MFIHCNRLKKTELENVEEVLKNISYPSFSMYLSRKMRNYKFWFEILFWKTGALL